MAAPVSVSIPHSLGQAEALRRLQKGLGDLPKAGLVSVEQQVWSDNRMTFAVRAFGQTAPGSLEVLDNAVRLEITLPALLQKLWEPLKQAVLGRAKLLLDKK